MGQTVVAVGHGFPDLSIERKVFAEADVAVREAEAETEEAVVEAARDADALLIQHAPVGRTVFGAVENLEVIGRYGIGVDTIDLDAATEEGVAVVNVPDYCLDEVPTHAVALLLAVERRIARYDAEVETGSWDWTTGRPIYRLRGRTLGLAGFGELARRVVRKVEPFGFEPIAYDPYVSADEMADRGVEKVPFDGLLERSDVVSVHAPLTDETRTLFDGDALAAMDEEAVLINTSRGEIVDVDALYDALVDGELRGAGLDVLPEEPPSDHPIVELDSAVITPHAAWYSEESMVQLRRTVAEDVLRVFRGRVPKNPVNEAVFR
ncbi:C-terminal binding protein [Halovivax sp.]|uniref:C-terminal binding protein n=1 Tax=Halovivax sp. TaxID=1935978 RepID=UPI0025BE3777|nr:C-terminal binding protein [Halovivax sp.]